MSEAFAGPVTITGDLIVTGPLGKVLTVTANPNTNPAFVVGGVNAQFTNIEAVGGITCFGPITSPAGLRVTGPKGDMLRVAADPNTNPAFVVTGVNAQFTNIQAVGGITCFGPMSCAALTCTSLAPNTASHVIDLTGGMKISANLIVGQDLVVAGDITLSGADCAEDFDVGAEVLAEPGTVMVLGEEGALFACLKAYDKRVAGVVSGGGEFKAALVLDKRRTDRNRRPLALIGKAYCKVDASLGAIEIGDLLTTSSTPGHAMKAQDANRAFGTVIGKALRPFADGLGLIPILVALQ